MNTPEQQDQAGKMAPYEESTHQVGADEKTASAPSPRQINPKVIGAIVVVGGGFVAALLMVQASKKQQAQDVAKQNQAQDKKVGVVGAQDAKEGTDKLVRQQQNKDELERQRKEREARDQANAKEPKPEQVLNSQVDALEAQLAQPLPGGQQQAAGVGPGGQAPVDPWVQARQQAQMQSAQTFYQERAAALRAPLFFGSGAPKDRAQGGAQAPAPEAANDEAAFLAQIKAAQAQSAQVPSTPQGFTVASAQGSAQLGAMASSAGQAQSPTQQTYDAQRSFFERGPSAAGRLGVNPAPRGPYVEAGTVVEIVLETGINSQLPGVILGRVSQPVYDPAMNRILIPSGTRVLGTYQAQAAPGQDRAQVSWLKLMLTDGRQVALPNEPGVDLSGMSGFEAEVDNHTDKLLLGASLSAVFSATGAVAGGPTNQFQVRPSQQAIYGATQPFQQMGEAFAKRYLEIKPTLKLAPGQKVGMLLTQDLAL